MYMLDFIWAQRCTGVVFKGGLCFGTIVNFPMLMGGVLRLGRGSRVPILGEDLKHVAVHCQMACVFGIVPDEVDAHKFCTHPVCGDFIVLLESMRRWAACRLPTYSIQILSMMKTNMDGSPLVAPEAWRGGALVIPMVGKAFGEKDIV